MLTYAKAGLVGLALLSSAEVSIRDAVCIGVAFSLRPYGCTNSARLWLRQKNTVRRPPRVATSRVGWFCITVDNFLLLVFSASEQWARYPAGIMPSPSARDLVGFPVADKIAPFSIQVSCDKMCACVWTCLWISVCICVCVCACMFTFVYVRVCVCFGRRSLSARPRCPIRRVSVLQHAQLLLPYALPRSLCTSRERGTQRAKKIVTAKRQSQRKKETKGFRHKRNGATSVRKLHLVFIL